MTNKVLYTYIIFFICCVSLLVTPVYAVNNGTLICNGTSVDNKTYSEINETLVCNGTLVDNKTYGGIPGNVSQPPEGTQINLLLSRYYQLPVATSEMQHLVWIIILECWRLLVYRRRTNEVTI